MKQIQSERWERIQQNGGKAMSSSALISFCNKP